MNVDILQNLIAKMYQPAPCGSVLELQKLSVQQQCGTHDCGLFAIVFALEVCLRSNVETACELQAKQDAKSFD